MTKNGRITVVLNDVTVIDDGQFDKVCGAALDNNLGTPGPIRLQDHGATVRFRKIEIEELISEKAATEGFHPLFNGKDLTRWSVASGAAERWKVEERQIKGTGIGSGSRGWLLSENEYENFVLTPEFQVAAEADGAVGIRARSGETEGGLPHHLAIELTGYANPRLPRIGAFYYWPNVYQQPSKQAAVVPNGEWNRLTVQVQGEVLRVSVNGQEVQNLDLGEFAKRANVFPGAQRASGRIGLQQHTGEIRFRKIEVKSLEKASLDPDRKAAQCRLTRTASVPAGTPSHPGIGPPVPG